MPAWHNVTDRFSVADARDPGPIPSLPDGGALVRLLIPYKNASIADVALDGHPLKPSKTDGYHLTRGPGTVVHVAIPPKKLRGLHSVTCKVTPGEERRSGFMQSDWA